MELQVAPELAGLQVRLDARVEELDGRGWRQETRRRDVPTLGDQPVRKIRMDDRARRMADQVQADRVLLRGQQLHQLHATAAARRVVGDEAALVLHVLPHVLADYA